MKDFAADYQRLFVQNVKIHGFGAMEDFHADAVKLIERAQATAMAQLQGLDQGLREDVRMQRANALMWEIREKLARDLQTKAEIYNALERTYKQRLAEAMSPATTADPVQALRWETQVNEVRRQLEDMTGPDRVRYALKAAQDGKTQILAALEGSLRPLVPEDVLDRVRTACEKTAAGDARKAYEDAVLMQDEAQRVAFAGVQALLSHVASNGFPGVSLNLRNPSPISEWDVNKRAKFVTENGLEAYNAAIRAGKIPPTPEEMEAEAETIRAGLDKILALPQ